MNTDALEPVSAQTISNKQKLFLRYFTAILVDLVVLNLFAEYSTLLLVDSFTTTLFAAVLLQALLQLTLAIEHRVAAYFNAKQGGFARFMRFFSAWAILFGSKFVILEALDIAFGDGLLFAGPLHGIVALIAIIVAMLVVEELILRFYRRLA